MSGPPRPEVDYEFFIYKGKSTATYPYIENPALDGPTKDAAIDNGFVRFTYSEENISREQRGRIIIDINNEVTRIFPDSKQMHYCAFPNIYRGQRFVDIQMGSINALRWHDNIKLTLPGGQTLTYFAKGIEIPECYVSISITDVTHRYTYEEICSSLEEALEGHKIIDVWVQYSFSKSEQFDLQHRKVPTGIMQFLVELCDFKIPAPGNTEPTTIVEKRDRETGKTYQSEFVYRLAQHPAYSIQRLPGFINVASASRDLKLLFRDRPNWCTICLSRAIEFHERKDCEDFFCTECGEHGHFRGAKTCSQFVKGRKPAAPASTTSSDPITELAAAKIKEAAAALAQANAQNQRSEARFVSMQNQILAQGAQAARDREMFASKGAKGKQAAAKRKETMAINALASLSHADQSMAVDQQASGPSLPSQPQQ